MPLNKAQLMETPGGPGVVGAVKVGTGINISGDGTISVNPATQVTKLVAGSNITLNPPDGFGAVTITATSQGGVTQINAGSGITVTGNTGNVTISANASELVTAITAGTGITVSGSVGNVTISTNPATQITRLLAGTNISLSPADGFGAVTVSSAGGGIAPIPAGSVMLFYQAGAPTGWTQVTSVNNTSIRIVSGTGGTTGGSIPFSTFFNTTSTYTGTVTITSGQVGATTLSTAQIPSHNHAVNAIALGCGNVANGPVQDRSTPGCNSVNSSEFTGGGDSHTHTLIGAVAGGNFNSNFDVQFANIILCSKN